MYNSNFKNILKKITPAFIKSMYHDLKIFRDNFYIASKQLKRKKIKVETNKVKVVFLVQRTEVWSSVQTIFEAANNREDVEPILLAIPPYRNGRVNIEDNSVFYFCKNISEKAINSYIKTLDSFFDIKQLKPTFIFLNTPYTDEYPFEYSMEKLAEAGTLCYVPYGYTMLEGGMQSVNLRRNLLAYVDYLFAENYVTYNYCKKNSILSNLFGKEFVYMLGFPRYDLYSDLPKTSAEKFTVLWIPRWTTGREEANGNEPSSFFLFIDKIIAFFASNSEIDLIIRPHPHAFENYIKNGEMTSDEVEDIIKEIDSLPNISFDFSSSYMNSLIKADVLLADYSSIVAEYFFTERPIIYYGTDDNFSEESRKMYKTFYNVRSWDDASCIIQNLLAGDDPKAKQRAITAMELLPVQKKKSGEMILSFLLSQIN